MEPDEHRGLDRSGSRWGGWTRQEQGPDGDHGPLLITFDEVSKQDRLKKHYAERCRCSTQLITLLVINTEFILAIDK